MESVGWWEGKISFSAWEKTVKSMVGTAQKEGGGSKEWGGVCFCGFMRKRCGDFLGGCLSGTVKKKRKKGWKGEKKEKEFDGFGLIIQQ